MTPAPTSPEPGRPTSHLPLCVDLDGTLIATDMLWESLARLLKKTPLAALLVPLWLLRGRACLKRELAARVEVDVTSLPYHGKVIEMLKEERAAGRKILLVTASDRAMATRVADHVGLFDEVLASDGKTNLRGEHKARALVERFGRHGFVYAGDSMVDLPVWEAAAAAIVVSPGDGIPKAARAVTQVERVIKTPGAGVKTYLKAFRVHQYSKNLLLLLPVMGAHKWRDAAAVLAAVAGMLSFSLCASSVYLLNDLLDLEADRHHPGKRHRPFASGALSPAFGLAAAPACFVAAVSLGLCLHWRFEAALVIYYIISQAYSVRLKQIALIDVIALAALYTIRILAGGCATGIPVSDWLLILSIFLFLSLAFAKRFTEMRLSDRGETRELKGRGYLTSDAELISAMGSASGYIAVLVLCIYVTQPSVANLYGSPRALLLACPVFLYWLSRVWLLAHRGKMHDDPIVFALKDRQSLVAAVLIVAIGLMANPK